MEITGPGMENPGKTIRVKTVLDPDEFVRFGIRQSARGPRSPVSPTFIGIEILIFAALGYFLLTSADPPAYRWQFAALGFGFLVALYFIIVVIPFYLTRSELVKNYKKSGVEGRELVFTFSESGFEYSNGEKIVTRLWSDIQKVTETPEVLGIFVGKSNVYLVPKRSFENGEFGQLREMMRYYLAAEILTFL